MSSNVWFTSDTHFSHRNIVKACSDWSDKEACRDFPSIEEHDAYLLNEINRRVRPTDTLFHLGDVGLGFAWRERFKELRAAIKCETICLLLGNHDHAIENQKTGDDLRALFKWVKHLHYGKVAGRPMVLCHYAMRTWPWAQHGGIHLYGHSHGNLPDDPNSLSLDVGMDTCLYGHVRYTPYSAEEIFAIMDQHKRFVPVDHHVA